MSTASLQNSPAYCIEWKDICILQFNISNDVLFEKNKKFQLKLFLFESKRFYCLSVQMFCIT